MVELMEIEGRESETVTLLKKYGEKISVHSNLEISRTIGLLTCGVRAQTSLQQRTEAGNRESRAFTDANAGGRRNPT